MALKNNPNFELKKESGSVRIYVLTNTMALHTKRYAEIFYQQIYANSGANAEVLRQTYQEMLDRCNDMKNAKTFRTDMSALVQSLMYRLEYPVDQHCAIRMGCICSFMEFDTVDVAGNPITQSEDPDD